MGTNEPTNENCFLRVLQPAFCVLEDSGFFGVGVRVGMFLTLSYEQEYN